MSKTVIYWVTGILIFFAGTGIWVWNRFGPSQNKVYSEKVSDIKIAKTLDSASGACDLTVRRYKQIGKEMQFELAASAGGLAPYDVEISQAGSIQSFRNVPHRFGVWLTIPEINLKQGLAEIKVSSLGQSGCNTRASFEYDVKESNQVLASDKWIRRGSKDNWLDVRPVQKGGRIYLKDFANYEDGRTRVIMIDGIAVSGLEKGIEVKSGYLYSVTARWIDAPYNDWWNNLRNRSLRQQNIYITGEISSGAKSGLTKIEIPKWFSPSKSINVAFDTNFPEFEPIAGKLVMQSRLNDYVPAQNYFKRGINYLNGSEKDVPSQKLHWTATPNYFADKDDKWFSGLTKSEAQSLAGIPDFGVYAFDFEFWNQQYSPDVKQRLLWFTQRIRNDHPNMFLMDYWGGGAYTNPHINKSGSKKPLDYVNDYYEPKPNNSNFEPLPNGESFQNLFNITPIDVYSKAMFPMDEQGNSANNYVLLSAVHSMRINKLIPFQKNNKFVFYAWNQYQPLYQDPIVPWSLQLTDPKGELILNQMETMPASQALSLSLFSLFLFDGYYLWHDGSIYGNDPNGYNVNKEAVGWGKEWYPADGKTNEPTVRRNPEAHGTPRFWDYPTEYYVLGNWMAKQVEDILVGGNNQDLAFELNGKWIEPKKEQAILAIDSKEPFVTSIVKGDQIAVLAVDSFQAPNASKTIQVKLPDGTQTSVELYGNWPALYRGKLKK